LIPSFDNSAGLKWARCGLFAWCEEVEEKHNKIGKIEKTTTKITNFN
jgi:hypothetical protein